MIGLLARVREWRLVAATAGAAALGLAGVTIAVLSESLYRVDKVATVTAQAEVLAATVQAALVFQDPAAAADAVEALQAARDIEAAGVYGADGARLARFSRHGEEPPATTSPRPGAWSDGRVTVAAPVRHEQEMVGTVYLRSSREGLAATLGRHTPTGLLLSTALLVVAAMGTAQRALRKANLDTEGRAKELEVANAALEDQMAGRERAEEALRQSQKMDAIGQLTGGIAHDFNNLLQAVRGSLDLIRRKPEDVEKVRRWADVGFAAAERGAKLTAQLLAFSRAQKLELKPVAAARVIERMQDLLSSTLGPAIRVRLELDAAGAWVLADPTQLELAVLNLAINARDAMPDGGDLTISTHPSQFEDDAELEPGDYLVISVIDTGVGMPDDVRARAFDPFFTTKGVGKGTGLGLAQVYGIAKQAGGVARIVARPGEGTTVCLILPQVAAGTTNATDEVAPVRRTTEGGGERVLVVDDDAGVRLYVKDALEQAGYRVDTAEDGVEALKSLARRRPDLVILDYAMPGMTGAEVAKAARETRPDLRVLFASGYAESDALEALVGPVRMLRKPFDSEELARAVRETLAG